jgi:high-affinity Fe2+/Pb2+ permease
MKDLLNKILMAAAGAMLAATFAAVALVAGGGATGSADRVAFDAPLLALVAGVLAAGVARGIRSARAAAGAPSHRRRTNARGRRFGSLVSRHSL